MDTLFKRNTIERVPVAIGFRFPLSIIKPGFVASKTVANCSNIGPLVLSLAGHWFMGPLKFSHPYQAKHPGIGIGIGLKHVHYQDSWCWSQIISNIQTCLGIGLDRNIKSRQVFLMVSNKILFQD